MDERLPVPLPPSPSTSSGQALREKGEVAPPLLTGEGVGGEVVSENASTLDRLVRSVDMAEGFALFFARCNVPAVRDALILDARQQLAALGVEVIEVAFEDEPINVRQQLRAALAAGEAQVEMPLAVALPFPAQPLALAEPRAGYEVAGKRAVFVTGLELGIPYNQPNARVLAELNLGRDLFPRDVPHPLVIWLPDYALTAVARYAPDFWAWRSGVFEFEAGEEKRHIALQQLARDRSWLALSNLSPEARLLRRRQLESLLDDYRDLPETPRVLRERARILADIGNVCVADRDYESAVNYLEKALALQRQVGDRAGEAKTLNNIGYVYANLGEQRQALEYYEQALVLLRQAGDRAGEAMTLHNIGAAYADMGERHKALEYFEQALALMRQVGDRASEATTLNDIGRVYIALGEQRQALEYFEQALTLRRQAGDRAGAATTLNNIGYVYANLGEQRQALDYYEQALELRRLAGDRVGAATTLHNIGRVYADLGEQRRALEYYEQALRLRRQAGDRAGTATTLHNLGVAYHNLGEQRQALEYFEQALELMRQVGDRDGEATTLHNIGYVYANLGDQCQALKYFEQAVAMWQQTGARWLERITRYNMAMVYQALGDLQRAEEELALVVALDEAIGHPDLASDRAALERVRAERLARGTAQ